MPDEQHAIRIEGHWNGWHVECRPCGLQVTVGTLARAEDLALEHGGVAYDWLHREITSNATL